MKRGNPHYHRFPLFSVQQKSPYYNMKKHLIFLLLFGVLPFCHLNAQQYTYWKPLVFLNNPPKWVHIPNDTTIPSFLPGILSGRDNFDVKKYVRHDPYLFSVYQSVYITLSGLFVDKIDLRTGELLHSFVFDKRNFEHKIGFDNAYINTKGELELLLYLYKSPLVYKHTHLGVMQLDTGNLALDNFFYTDIPDTTITYVDAYIRANRAATDSTYYFYHFIWDTFPVNNMTYYKLGFERTELDPYGHSVSDTMVYFKEYPKGEVKAHRFYDIFDTELRVLDGDSLLYINSRYFDNDSTYCSMYYFDLDLHLIGEYDIHQYFDSNTVLTKIRNIDHNYVYLRAKKPYPNTYSFVKHHISLIFDHQGHLKERIDLLNEKGEKLYTPLAARFPGIEGTVVFNGNYRDTTFDVWQSDGHGKLHKVKTIHFSPDNCIILPTRAESLPDGDILLYGLYTRDTVVKGERRVYGYARFVMRFDREDLGLKPLKNKNTSLTRQMDYSLSPNPLRDVLHLRFDEPFQGSISIYDELGHEMTFKKLPEGTRYTNIRVQHLPKGAYYIHPIEHKRKAYHFLNVKSFVID